MFEGYYRMRLIHQLLSGDMIDESALFPTLDSQEAAAALVSRIVQTTQMDAPLVDRTIKSLITVGYLKSEPADDGLKWFWTYNNRSEHSPFA